MKIVVTGSRGLIGRSLCQRLVGFGHEIIELDNCITPDDSGYGDVLDPICCHRAIAQADGVFHLAAVSRVVWGERDPELCMAVNVVGTVNVLEACHLSPKRPWVLVASSREVYGQASHFPVSENAEKQPMNVYAHSKCQAEQAVEQACESGLRAGFVRLSSVYGDAFDHTTRVVPAFITAALSGHPLVVEGSDNVLDFTHVDDVTRGMVALGNSLAKGLYHGSLHFVSGQPTTLIDLAKMITRLTGSSWQINIAPPRSYDVSQFLGNPEKALCEINWKNETPLINGLSRLIHEFQKMRNIS